MNVRTKILILFAVLLAAVAGLFGRQVTHGLTAFLVIRSEAPAQSVLVDLIDSAGDPGAFARKLWRTQKIPHRYAVMSYLRDHVSEDDALFGATSDLILDAARDVDLNNRELALGILERHEDARRLEVVQWELADADRDVRLLGLQYLRKLGNEEIVPTLIKLLDDPEPMVVVRAAAHLRRITHKDLGIRAHNAVALPQPHGPNLVPPENLAKIHARVEQWEAWWTKHHGEFHGFKQTKELRAVALPKMPVADFELKDVQGNPVRLSQFRGKAVLLNFWTTWCTACAMEMPDLVALNEQVGDRLVILGVALDGSGGQVHEHASFLESEAGAEPGGEGSAGLGQASEEDPAHHEGGPDLERIKSQIRRIIKKKGLRYPIVMDPSGVIGARFNGHELPTNVLIDPQGFVRRRFIGSRPLETWERLVDEVYRGSKKRA